MPERNSASRSRNFRISWIWSERTDDYGALRAGLRGSPTAEGSTFPIAPPSAMVQGSAIVYDSGGPTILRSADKASSSASNNPIAHSLKRMAGRVIRRAVAVLRLGWERQVASFRHSDAGFPLALDLSYYRRHNIDLKTLTDDELAAHFADWGEAEGRAGSALSLRENFLKVIPQGADTLEIGPFCAPQLRGEKVRYFDIASREDLIIRAGQLQYAFTDAPVIDFVSPSGDMGIINEQFDQIFSSHCIEHQPDFVRHLMDVSRILRDRGLYFLIVPDKRYCFDHYLSESTIADVLGAHVEQKHLHYAKSVLEHRFLTTHNDAGRHWQGDHGFDDIGQKDINNVRASLEYLSENPNEYIDTHAWHFTPAGFKHIVNKLYDLGLTKLRAERVYNTPFGRFEFCAILENT
jgi:SAM-dependent methyltransferase